MGFKAALERRRIAIIGASWTSLDEMEANRGAELQSWGSSSGLN
jgi:hypothetical protein